MASLKHIRLRGHQYNTQGKKQEAASERNERSHLDKADTEGLQQRLRLLWGFAPLPCCNTRATSVLKKAACEAEQKSLLQIILMFFAQLEVVPTAHKFQSITKWQETATKASASTAGLKFLTKMWIHHKKVCRMNLQILSPRQLLTSTGSLMCFLI